MAPTRRAVLEGGAGVVTASLAGCLSEPGTSGDDERAGYAAFFALWDWAQQVGGDRFRFENPVSVGEMGHGWDPPGDLTRDVAGTDAFVYLDTPEFAWAQEIAAQLETEDVAVIDAMEGLSSDQLLGWDQDSGQDDHDHGGHEGDDHEEDGHEEHDDHGEHDHEGTGGADEFHDPHVWADPVLAEAMVGTVATALGELDPDGADVYRENADAYAERLADVDGAFEALGETAALDVAVLAGHHSFRYLEARYDFRFHSPGGVSPNASPSPGDIGETIDLVENHGIETILYDPFEAREGEVPPLAQTILENTPATEAAPVTNGEGTTEEWLENGWSWVEQMEEVTVPSLRAALDLE